jgi:hypothetical protein
VGTTPVDQNAVLRFSVDGNGPVPSSGVTSVVMNVTVTCPTAPSFFDRVP